MHLVNDELALVVLRAGINAGAIDGFHRLGKAAHKVIDAAGRQKVQVKSCKVRSAGLRPAATSENPPHELASRYYSRLESPREAIPRSVGK
jgi:hypothetical protein